MKTQLIVPVLGLAFLFCAACGGGAHKRPALQHPVTPPQEYRQETSGPNNPGSLFAASEEDTLFADSRARRVGAGDSAASCTDDAAPAALAPPPGCTAIWAA